MENKITPTHSNHTVQKYGKPTCYTTVAWRTLLTPNQNLTIGVTMSLTVIPAIVLNSAYCYALYKTRQLRKKSKLLVFLQSVSDFFFGAISIPCSVILFTAYGNIRCCWLERLAMFLGQTNGHISLYLLITIAMQRYFAVRPRHGNSNNRLVEFALLSFKGLAVVVCIVIIWSIFHGLVSVYFFGYLNSGIPNILVMILRPLIALLTYTIYFRLYFSVRKHQRDMTANLETSSRLVHAKAIKRNYSSFLKTVSMVLIVNVLSYIPILIADCWTGYYTFRNIYAPRIIRFIYYIVHFTLFLNSSLNTAIFLFRDVDSRAFLREKLCGKRAELEEIRLEE